MILILLNVVSLIFLIGKLLMKETVRKEVYLQNNQIKTANFLATGAEAEVLTSGWAVQNYPSITFISLAGQSNETISLPDERDTVIKLILN